MTSGATALVFGAQFVCQTEKRAFDIRKPRKLQPPESGIHLSGRARLNAVALFLDCSDGNPAISISRLLYWDFLLHLWIPFPTDLGIPGAYIAGSVINAEGPVGRSGGCGLPTSICTVHLLAGNQSH